MRDLFVRLKIPFALGSEILFLIMFVKSKEIFDDLYDFFMAGTIPSPEIELRGTHITRIVLLSACAVTFLLFVWAILPRSILRPFRRKTPAEKLWKKYGKWPSDAWWGYGIDRWTNVTLDGRPLIDHVLPFLCRAEQREPLPAKDKVLRVPTFEPVEKTLRLFYPNKTYISINESNGVLKLDPNAKINNPDAAARLAELPKTNDAISSLAPAQTSELLSAKFGRGSSTRDVYSVILEFRGSNKKFGVNHYDLKCDDPAPHEYKWLTLGYGDGRKYKIGQGKIPGSLFMDMIESGFATNDWIEAMSG